MCSSKALKMPLVSFCTFRTHMMLAEQRKALEDYRWKVAWAHRLGLGLSKQALSLAVDSGSLDVLNPEALQQGEEETRWSVTGTIPFSDAECALRDMVRAAINQVAPNLLKGYRDKVTYKELISRIGAPESLSDRRLSRFIWKKARVNEAETIALEAWARKVAPGCNPDACTF